MRKNSVLTKTISKRIRKHRRLLNLTQEELAEKVGVSRVYMGFIEQGRSTPSLEVLEKISKIFRLKITDLVS